MAPIILHSCTDELNYARYTIYVDDHIMYRNFQQNTIINCVHNQAVVRNILCYIRFELLHSGLKNERIYHEKEILKKITGPVYNNNCLNSVALNRSTSSSFLGFLANSLGRNNDIDNREFETRTI